MLKITGKYCENAAKIKNGHAVILTEGIIKIFLGRY
jgi:hypothetical protein